jgi:hypothetical protein
MKPRGAWALACVALVCIALVSACCPRPPSGATAPATEPVGLPAPRASASDGAAERAAFFIERARREEPALTPILVALAQEMGAEMYKLEFRLKSASSAERKIRLVASDNRMAVSDVWLDDALRYTMRVDDEPKGHYIETVRAALTRLEEAGHVVKRVKNYWPANDNYSGINSVLETPGGLEWELQFHTSASIAAQDKTRQMYETMRLRATPLDDKRRLFDSMTQIWNAVAIPEGSLLPGAGHPKSDLRDRPRP